MLICNCLTHFKVRNNYEEKVLFLNLVLFALAFTASAKKYGLHFDDHGNIISPDKEFLARGLDDEKDGFRDVALKNFKLSAEYGNHLAMSLVGLYHMQDKNYVEAWAWYDLVNAEKLPNSAMLKDLKSHLVNLMSPKQLKEAKKVREKLSAKYGSYAALMRREAWKNDTRNGMTFTGSHIRGHIPNMLTVKLNSGMSVSGFEIRKQIDEYIYEYEYDYGKGDVNLKDVEIIED